MSLLWISLFIILSSFVSLLLGMQLTCQLSYICCWTYSLFLMNFMLMPWTSLCNPVIWEEWYFYFFIPHIYNSFLFLLQSHFITKLIKTDERDILVIFMFLWSVSSASGSWFYFYHYYFFTEQIIFFFLIYLFYLFLAALGVRCCARAFL